MRRCKFQFHLRRRHLSGIVLASVLGVQPFAPAAAPQSPAERGHLVYTSEDCGTCHSDGQHKAPDLSTVGSRRSVLWLKMHLYNPREVSGSSIMPPYAKLFRTERGNDLVAYLSSLRESAKSKSANSRQTWRIPPEAIAAGDPQQGQSLYNRYCATCHNANGPTRVRWQSEFIESPAIFRAGVMPPDPSTRNHLAQIIKFGIPDSDMAGHETMPDKDIASLVIWLTQNPVAPVKKQ